MLTLKLNKSLHIQSYMLLHNYSSLWSRKRCHVYSHVNWGKCGPFS